jgi:PIN domain nuclease of toxin-antitoxin system
VGYGELPIAATAIPRFHELIEADGFQHLPITHLHALHAGSLPQEHCDPFDRMLAAQSTLESAPLVSRDPAFALFGTEIVW